MVLCLLANFHSSACEFSDDKPHAISWQKINCVFGFNCFAKKSVVEELCILPPQGSRLDIFENHLRFDQVLMTAALQLLHDSCTQEVGVIHSQESLSQSHKVASQFFAGTGSNQRLLLPLHGALLHVLVTRK